MNSKGKLAIGILTAVAMFLLTLVLPRGGPAAGCGIGTVSVNGRGVGDFRSVVCKVEMTRKFSHRSKRVPL